MNEIERLEALAVDLEAERLRLIIEREAVAAMVFGSDVIECIALGPLCALIDLGFGELETRLGALDTMLEALERHAGVIIAAIKRLEAGGTLPASFEEATSNILDAAEDFSAINDTAEDVAGLIKDIVKDTKKAAGLGISWLPWALGGAGLLAGGVALLRMR